MFPTEGGKPVLTSKGRLSPARGSQGRRGPEERLVLRARGLGGFAGSWPEPGSRRLVRVWRGPAKGTSGTRASDRAASGLSG